MSEKIKNYSKDEAMEILERASTVQPLCQRCNAAPVKTKGLCNKCYSKQIYHIKKEAKAGSAKTESSAPLRLCVKNKKAAASANPNIENPDTVYLMSEMLTIFEKISKQMIDIRERLISVKTIESAERVKLYQRIKAVEAFLEKGFAL